MNSKIIEKRLIDFSVLIIKLSKSIYRSDSGIFLADQIVRSSISPALNYGEAQSAESIKGFIHKMKIVVKELRETYVSLRILKEAKLCKIDQRMDIALDECNQLISIFVASIKTSQQKLK